IYERIVSKTEFNILKFMFYGYIHNMPVGFKTQQDRLKLGMKIKAKPKDNLSMTISNMEPFGIPIEIESEKLKQKLEIKVAFSLILSPEYDKSRTTILVEKLKKEISEILISTSTILSDVPIEEQERELEIFNPTNALEKDFVLKQKRLPLKQKEDMSEIKNSE
ncbi:MAG: hypothetical protein ACTSO3_16835, partial [Candidatus Heimdallarchaeaceae archaeon]